MSDSVLDSVAKFINSPPGQFAAGAVLAGGVWKAFGYWEAVASEDDKVQVWIWLAQPEIAKHVESWPQTFARLFDRVFGTEHLSWRCFKLSCIFSFSGVVLMVVLWGFLHTPKFWAYIRHHPFPFVEWVPAFCFMTAVPDYISLLKSRWLLKVMARVSTVAVPILIVVDYCLTLVIAVGAYLLCIYMPFIKPENRVDDLRILLEPPTLESKTGYPPLSALFYPAFFTALWVTLYGISGLLLKLAKRLDVVLGWFTRRLNIEKRPLQSIGLVAGVLVAIIYWAAVIVSRLV